MSRVYCSDAARLRGDDNAGSASRIDVWILVELPVTWGREPISDAPIPPPVVETLRVASHAIPRCRVVFIRKRVECLGPTRVYIVRSAPTLGMAALDLATIDAVTELDFPLILSHLSPEFTPLVLVCTHGQHDSCCGRRGYPLFDALRKREGLEVWQCSHIGGDRFAANAVVLPWGLYYGPVEPRDADALADTIANDDILLPAYRGRSSLSRPAQAADIFVRRATGLTGRDALRFVSREDLPGHRTRIRLKQNDGTRHDVVIEQYIAHDIAMLTCTSKTTNSIPQFRLIEHRATAGSQSR